MIGRQISFFFTPVDENKFLAEIKKRGDAVITDKNTPLDVQDASDLNKGSYSQVLIRLPKSEVYYSAHGFIDGDRSEVIEYSRSISMSFFTPLSGEKPTFDSYVSDITPNTYISFKGKVVKAVDLSREELREQYELEQKKAANRDKRILEPGRLWAAMQYYDGDTLIRKGKWFKDWVSSYINWIKKQSRLSKSKEYYVGENAYQAYKETRHILMTSSNYKVELG